MSAALDQAEASSGQTILDPDPRANGQVVVIDDEEPIRNYLSNVLGMDGYECICFAESLLALSYLARNSLPDLVMTDIRMPQVDGLEVVRRVHDISKELPVILISGAYDLATALEALRAGASDYLYKPAKPAEVLSLVAKHVRPGGRPEYAAVHLALAKFISHCEGPSELAWLAKENGPVLELYRSLGIKRWETMQHCLRVAAYAVLLGRACRLGETQLYDLEMGALLHDIGKVGIPHNVLLKPSTLDDKEWEIIRTHPRLGHQLLVDFPQLQRAAALVLCHHERFDGRGYPRGLSGEEIPVIARIFSIVDTVDAITCDRPYRKARPFDHARREIAAHSGAQFDPRLVDIFMTLTNLELAAIRDRFPDTPPAPNRRRES